MKLGYLQLTKSVERYEMVQIMQYEMKLKPITHRSSYKASRIMSDTNLAKLNPKPQSSKMLKKLSSQENYKETLERIAHRKSISSE